MSIFKRKNKKSVVRFEPKHIPLPVLIRQVLYDSMLMPVEGIAVAMGLPPISDEVSEMEERASEDRLQAFSELIPFIDSHADIAARIATASYVLGDDETMGEKFGEEDTQNLTKLFKLISLSSSMSCISTLFNLGLLESKAVHDGK